MKLDPSKSPYDQEFWWVAHPDGASTDAQFDLVKRRYELEIIGGVQDKDASYSYDDWALCRLGNKYYLLSTSGCSCPSPAETWRIEIGPTSLKKIKTHVESGEYEGYTVPKKQLDEFLALIKGASK